MLQSVELTEVRLDKHNVSEGLARLYAYLGQPPVTVTQRSTRLQIRLADRVSTDFVLIPDSEDLYLVAEAGPDKLSVIPLLLVNQNLDTAPVVALPTIVISAGKPVYEIPSSESGLVRDIVRLLFAPLRAKAQHRALERAILSRSAAKGSVLAPTIAHYTAWLSSHPDKPLENLTAHLLAAHDETRDGIRSRMQSKWADKGGTASDVEKSVTNSMRRSAGTNFQALVSYALSTALRELDSAWYLSHPVPRDFGESLAIRFTGGVEGADDETFRVIPDLDILVRNASWRVQDARREPVLLLSVKTSIADRGGMAARWKNYFDLVTNPCPYREDPSCAWARLGISLEQELHYEITQGIVVANIYKIESDQSFTLRGELHSGQARANTYMFDLKLTTRTDDPVAVPFGWDPLERVLDWAAATSEQYDLLP